jgi:hypothetical protein
MKLRAIKRKIILRNLNCAKKSRQKRGGERIFLKEVICLCCIPTNKPHKKVRCSAQNGYCSITGIVREDFPDM